MYENRKYVVFNASESGSIQFYEPATHNESGSLLTEATASEVLETSAETLRLSVDGSKSFIKYERAPAIAEVLYEEGNIIPSGSEVGDLKTVAVAEEEVPASIAGLSSKSEEYTHSEIMNVLTGSEWSGSEA